MELPPVRYQLHAGSGRATTSAAGPSFEFSTAVGEAPIEPSLLARQLQALPSFLPASRQLQALPSFLPSFLPS